MLYFKFEIDKKINKNSYYINKVYIGCFADSSTGSNRDLPNSVGISTMTVEACISACLMAGYLYAGLQSGYFNLIKNYGI
jgi:hypothetical protein